VQPKYTLKVKWLIVAGALLFATPATAQPSKVIDIDMGGTVAWYVDRYKADARAGTHFIIKRYCASACTVILGIIPRERVCVEPAAAMGFHSGYNFFEFWHSPATTRLMLRYYDADVRADLVNFFNWRGNTPHTEVMWLRAGRYYRICGQPVSGPTGITKD